MTTNKLYLAGDIGGTKTKIALLSKQKGALRTEAKDSFASRDHAGLEPVLEKFLSGREVEIEGACFGIAGPIVAGQVETPNLPWVVDSRKVARALGLKSVALLNDLEAAAYGIFTLGSEELVALNEAAERRPGNKVLIAAGTGLGEATLYDDGAEYHPSASEGGHGDFAPTDETQIELLRALIEKFGHVSYERILSGPGLKNIYDFLKDRAGAAETDSFGPKLAGAADPSAAITQAALAGESDLCVQALHLFASIYGAEAGNLALRGKAIGGVYVGGGIAPKILAKLRDGAFMRAFVDKGRYRELLAAIPVRVILNEETPLQGAAYYAAFRFHG